MTSKLDFMVEKSYPCNVCDAAFYVENNLLKHAKEHKGVRKTCMYRKKEIKSAQNHQKACAQNPNRPSMWHGGGDAGDNRFRFVESEFGKIMVLYRKPLNTATINDVKLAFSQKSGYVLQSEVAERLGITWSFISRMVYLYKFTDPAAVTDTPVNMNPTAGVFGDEYVEGLDTEFGNMIDELDTFEKGGSGWALHEFVLHDATLVTYTPWKIFRRNCGGKDGIYDTLVIYTDCNIENI